MGRRLVIAAVAGTAVLLVAGCVPPESGGAARLDDVPSPLQPLPAASATAAPTVGSTTTAELPPGPAVGEGTVCDLYDPATRELGIVSSDEIREASGIAASRRRPAYWVVNDSGNRAVLHAVGPAGDQLGSFELAGTVGFDWEDIAIGPGPEPGVSYVYIGDIGDNLRLRRTISLLRFPEPDLVDPPAMISDIATIRLTYPDSAVDSEAFWVDPITGDVFVVTKPPAGEPAVVFRAPVDALQSSRPTPMTEVARLRLAGDGAVTAADVTSDGTVLALRGYSHVWMWARTDLAYEQTLATEPCLGPSPDEIQGEALTFVPGELTYVTLSEGADKPLNQVTPLNP